MDEVRVGPAEWDTHIADARGPQLVVAGPGAGKTEFLVRRALHLIDSGVRHDQVLMLSFSRRGAADLRGRVEAGLERSFTGLAASTFHSLAFRLLETYRRGGEMPTLLTSPEQVQLVFELLSTEDGRAWPTMFRPILATRTFAQEVAEFLQRCHERLVDPESLGEAAATRQMWRGLPDFLARYQAELNSRRRIDYGMLQAQAVDLLGDDAIAEAVAEQYPFVLVDEYQDTTLVQARLLHRLYAVHGDITVAGDPYQSIYSFRGTELGNIETFPAQFPRRDGSPARRIVLTASFRVPRVVLGAAERVTAGGDLPGAAGEVEPAPHAGALDVRIFSQQTEEAEWIASEIHRRHLTSGNPYASMAVLVRSKRRFVAELSRACHRRGIPHDRPDTRLADQPAIRLILDLVIAATESGSEQERAVRRLVLGPLLTAPVGQWRELQRRRLHEPASWGDVLRRQIVGTEEIAALLDDRAWAVEMPASDGFWHVWTALPQFAELAGGEERTVERTAWASLGQVLGRFNERNPRATLRDYLELNEAEEFEAEPLLAYRPPEGDRLTITTLHQAKGLEFDTVFIADAVEGVFPDLRSRESLLQARLLADDAPETDSAYRRSRLQEEMRLAYTAMCRARSRVVWTATGSGVEEGQTAPSRFLALVAGSEDGEQAETRRAVQGPPTTLIEAEGSIRRSVTDPASPEAQRLAGISVLAGGVGRGLRPPEHFHGFRPPGPDSGIIPADHVLSPTQAQSYEDCPRRYVLENRLIVDSDASIYMIFGNLLHAVLEQAERVATGAGRPSTLEDSLDSLGRLFDPADFGGDPWATAWRRRAEEAMRHLYDNWPDDSMPVVALEHPLELDLDNVVWRGRADRIEGDGELLQIVDYKTTRNPPTVDEGAASLQLGMYIMAAGADPGLVGEASSCRAEMWFPVKPAASLIRRRFDPARLDEVAGRLVTVAAGIAAEDWAPRPSEACNRCAVRIVCPAWPEGREAFG